jgi:purine-nucleoside phosphorylase
MKNNFMQAAEFINTRLKKTPDVAIILGSGLGDFAQTLEDKISIKYSEIPHFAPTTVVGHSGNIVVGTIDGISVMAFQGRFHSYEGKELNQVILPVRVARALGVKKLIVTNASGGINSNFKPGDLVLISDHINMAGRNPLMGENLDELGPRFPDMSDAYSKKWRQNAIELANANSIELHQGIYAWVLGPSYETPAEIRMLKTIGADMVGMSTVPEVIAAVHAGIKVLGITCITNYAAGLIEQVLDHNDVKEVANQANEKFTKLLKLVIKNINN